MKTFLSICFLVAFVGLMLIGCSDKSISPIETTGVNDNPVVLQKDTGPGAWIIKDEFTGAFWFFGDNGLLVLIGQKNDPWSHCSGVRDRDLFSFKDIYLPNADPELRRIIEQIKGKDLVARVYYVDPWPSGYWETFCQFWRQVEPMEPFAIGTANFLYVDNDLLAWAQDNKNHNAFDYKANGKLIGQDGQKYILNVILKGVWDGVDLATYKEVFKIQLTPTGK
jgi:hypothetical protein